MKERNHLINVLKKVLDALKNKDYVKIKNLSNHVIHTSSIEQDPDIISAAVIIYALSKMIEREFFKAYPEWPYFYKNYIKGIENSIKYLKRNNIEYFRKEIHIIRESIEKLSGNLRKYIEEVFRKSSINKASKIYEHGISMEKTASILGISIWELAEYAGQTGVSDVNLAVTMPVKERIKIAEGIFE